jgi:hypothetical protein
VYHGFYWGFEGFLVSRQLPPRSLLANCWHLLRRSPRGQPLVNLGFFGFRKGFSRHAEGLADHWMGDWKTGRE